MLIDGRSYEFLKRIGEQTSWDTIKFLNKNTNYYGSMEGMSKIFSQHRRQGYTEYPNHDQSKVQLTQIGIDAMRAYEQEQRSIKNKKDLETQNLSLQNRQLQISIEQERQDSTIKRLTQENLNLQNKHYQYLETQNEQQHRIQNLSEKNFKLQNRALRRQWLFLVIGLIMGFVSSNFDFVLNFFTRT